MAEAEKMPAWAAAIFIFILLFAPLILGEITQLPTFKAMAYSVLIGIFMAFMGYFKTQGETFDPEKFLITPLTGAFAGLVMAFYGYDYTHAVTWLANAGVLSLIEIVGKAMVRRLWK